MTLQTAAPLATHSLSSGARSAREIAVTYVNEGWLDTSPPYQRSSVWTTTQAINLIRSFLQGIPVPSVLVNDRGTPAWRAANGTTPLETGGPIYALVDGKQRIEATASWFRGDLAVPASWFAADDVLRTVQTDDGAYVTHDGLSDSAQGYFRGRALLTVVEARVTTVAEEADLYLLVNASGTAQTEDDLARARALATAD